ncbi:MAG: anti-sigma factor domain-containing protein [Phenylobacterium sp.]|uniref:anti-sigma factor n=1 Tax=Phenylobacterium sp. TaxID=1871053 RepID=UPI0039198560
MSDTGPEIPEEDMLAAEHALGVLNARERGEAEARMARDPGFAAEVAAWRERLSGLFAEIAPVPAPDGLWARIERLLAANDNFEDLRRRLSMWRGAAAGAFALAAASLAGVMVMATQPPQVIEAPASAHGALLNANLATQGGQPLFVAAYDPDRKALIITSLVPPGTDPLHVHQLWLIPEDGKPRSLGMVEPGTSKALPMPGDMATLVDEGAELAVSVEAPGGSPDPNGPTGPVAAQGELSKI